MSRLLVILATLILCYAELPYARAQQPAPPQTGVAETATDAFLQFKVLFDKKDYKAALPLIDRALELELAQAKTDITDEYATYLGWRADTHEALGQFDRSIEDLSRAIEICLPADGCRWAEDNLNFRNQLIPRLRKSGQADRAVQLVDEALDLITEWKLIEKRSVRAVPTLDFVVFNRLQLDRCGSAIEPARLAISIIEENRGGVDDAPAKLTRFQYFMGRCLTKLQRFDEARPALQRALDQTVSSKGYSDAKAAIPYVSSLAENATAQGRHDEAAPLLERLVTLRIKDQGAKHAAVGWALNSLSNNYAARGKSAEALDTMQRALDILAEAGGPSSAELIVPLLNMAVRLDALGRSDAALDHVRRARSLLEAKPSRTPRDIVNLGDTYEREAIAAAEKQQNEEALRLYQRAHDFYVSAGSDGVPDLINVMLLQARELSALGRPKQAEAAAKAALARTQERSGEDSIAYAAALTTLRSFHQKDGRYLDAEAAGRRVLDIRQRKLGGDHADVGRALSDLADVLSLRGLHTEAEVLGRRAVAIAEAGYKTNPASEMKRLEVALNELGVVLSRKGSNQEALKFYQRSLDILQKRPDAKELEIARKHQNMSAVLFTLGFTEQARKGSLRFLEAVRQTRGEKNWDYVIALSSASALERNLGRLVEAEAKSRQALALAEELVGVRHPNYAARLRSLAFILRQFGRFDEAKELVQQAMSIFDVSVEPTHPDRIAAVALIGDLEQVVGNFVAAEERMLQVLKMREAMQGEQSADVASAYTALGDLYLKMDRRPDAISALERSYAIEVALFGATYPGLGSKLLKLGELARLDGRSEDADKMFKQAFSLTKSGVVEMPVFFATDRRLLVAPGGGPAAFSGERGDALSFGQSTVAFSKAVEAGYNAPFAESVRSDDAATDTTRLLVQRVDVRSPAQVVESARVSMMKGRAFEQDVLLFVHGYNVSFEDGLKRTAQIKRDLNFDGAAFLFSWPSRGRLMSYGYDLESAGLAVNDLIEFLDKIVAEAKPKRIHLIAHSMGNMVLLPALEKITYSRDLSARLPIGEIVLASPDVDRDRFVQMVKSIKGQKSTITMYVSASDRALWVSQILRDLMPRAGGGAADALVVPGVDTIDVTEAGAGFFSLNHDVYSTSPFIVSDMRRLLQSGERPPHRRSAGLVEVKGNAGAFWRYRAPAGP